MDSITGENQAAEMLMLFSHVMVGVKTQISLPSHIPKPVKSLPLYIPDAWKRYPFRAEPPHKGHNREYPAPLQTSMPISTIPNSGLCSTLPLVCCHFFNMLGVSNDNFARRQDWYIFREPEPLNSLALKNKF